ncbi:MAG: hypothetical protein U0K35_01800 [Prevotella sp.]|nr:hypothetical protein [Prevotella sp.]
MRIYTYAHLTQKNENAGTYIAKSNHPEDTYNYKKRSDHTLLYIHGTQEQAPTGIPSCKLQADTL